MVQILLVDDGLLSELLLKGFIEQRDDVLHLSESILSAIAQPQPQSKSVQLAVVEETEEPSADDGYDYQSWVEAYNNYKPTKWPKLQQLTESRKKVIRGAIKEHSGLKTPLKTPGAQEAAREHFILALCWVRLSPDGWWRDKCSNPGFEVLLKPRTQHFIKFGEEAKQRNINPSAIAASGLGDKQIEQASFLRMVNKVSQENRLYEHAS